MATLIDSLVVRLGLDSKGVTSETPKVTKSLKDVETQAARTESGFNGLARAATGFLAIIGGTTAIKAMISNFIEANGALDRLSKNLGVSASEISAWDMAVEQVGGTAAGLEGTLDGLNKAQTELMLTGQSSLIPYLSMLGVSLLDASGNAKSVTDELLSIGDAVNAKIAGGMSRLTGNNILRAMGIDQGTANVLLSGNRKELELFIRRQKENAAVTDAQAAEAAKLQKQTEGLKQQFAALGRSLIMEATPALERIFEALRQVGEWVSNNREFVIDFLKVLGVTLGAIAIASLPLTGTIALIGALGAAIALLWQDYQTWKRGGDSLIDWAKWEPGIKAAGAGLEWLAKKAAAAFGVIWSGAKVARDAINGNWAGVQQGTNEMTDKLRATIGLKPLEHAAIAPNAPETISPQRAMDYFVSRGMSKEEAAGLAAQIHSESGGRTNASVDTAKEHAYGLLQWHRDRQANFAALNGHDIRHSTADEQLDFIVHELNSGSETSAGKRLRGAKTAMEAGSIASKFYVRPADVDGEAASRGAFAASLMGTPGAANPARQASSGGGVGGGNKTVTQTIGDVIINTQATDAEGIAADFNKRKDYLLTSQANLGLN